MTKSCEKPVREHPLLMALDTCCAPALLCPTCGFDYVHPIGLECVSAGSRNSLVRIDADGVHQDPRGGAAGRGVRIALEFLCENGHRFIYTFSFHKGLTVLWPLVYPEAIEPEKRPRTIWRD